MARGGGGGARHRLITWNLIEFNISWVIYLLGICMSMYRQFPTDQEGCVSFIFVLLRWAI